MIRYSSPHKVSTALDGLDNGVGCVGRIFVFVDHVVDGAAVGAHHRIVAAPLAAHDAVQHLVVGAARNAVAAVVRR